MGDLEEKVTTWIETITGELKGDQGFGDWLRDGKVLCKLANTIQPGICPKVHASTMPFKQMENISAFVRACRELGVLEKDVFSTVDLYEQKNLKPVYLCIHNLGSVVRTTAPDFQGPYLGAAQSGAGFDVAREKQTALRGDTGFRRDMDLIIRQEKMSLCKEHAAGSTLDPTTTGLRRDAVMQPRRSAPDAVPVRKSSLAPPTTAAAGGTRGYSAPPQNSRDDRANGSLRARTPPPAGYLPGRQQPVPADAEGTAGSTSAAARAPSPGSVFARDSWSWPMQSPDRPAASAAAAAPRLSGPLLKLSPSFLGGWQLRWFEIGGGSVRYYLSPDDAKARAKPKGEVSVAGLRVQKKSDSAFDFTTLRTGDRTFSLDANVGSYVGSAGWDLGGASLPTAQHWVSALEQEAMAMVRKGMMS